MRNNLNILLAFVMLVCFLSSGYGQEKVFSRYEIIEEIAQFVETGAGIQHFEMEDFPLEGEELTAEVIEELNAIAELLTFHPDLKLSIFVHTSIAANEVGKKVKKVSSQARATWYKLKLATRGVETHQLEAIGKGCEELLPEIEKRDENQNRIVFKFSFYED